MTPQDAIKDRWEYDDDRCYDCNSSLDECVCNGDDPASLSNAQILALLKLGIVIAKEETA